ncbi:MAG TPA: hypothetical protein VN380_01465 [Thermoanaerobaculia bacterium]|jgi:hypothetical protein|nr:hypothetical protein [Thermoanaerobaculia bacterium]
MRRISLVLLSVCFVFAAVGARAQSGFSGTYAINGTNPGAGAYQGTLKITPRGDVYDVRWSIANLTYTGVGIVVNDTLSVAYTDGNLSFIGVAAYRHRHGGYLDGQWAVKGGTTLGTETALRR